MTIVKTRVKQTDKKGMGLFADEFIPKGTVWWVWDDEYDRIFDEEYIENLPQVQKDFMDIYTWEFEKGKFYLCSDNAKYTNHSYTPNSINDGNGDRDSKAIKDIEIGEEITENYMTYELRELDFDVF